MFFVIYIFGVPRVWPERISFFVAFTNTGWWESICWQMKYFSVEDNVSVWRILKWSFRLVPNLNINTASKLSVLYTRLLFGHSTSHIWYEMKARAPKRELSVCLTGSTTFLPFLCVALSEQTWIEYKRVALFYKFPFLISRFTWLHSCHGFVAKCVEANNVRKVGVLFRVERMSAKRPLSLIETEAETDTGAGTATLTESGTGTRTVSGLLRKPIKANSAGLTQCRFRIAPGRAGRLRRRRHAQMVFIS